MKENDTQSVSKEVYDDLVKRANSDAAELELLRQKSPLVGVRWYGQGGFGIGLSHPVCGMTKLVLDGCDDKAVIDYTTWLRIRKTEQSRWGLLVRDDSVITELGLMGVTAKPDNTPVGPNSFTEKEAENILLGSIKDFKKAVAALDNHWACFRLLFAAKKINMTALERISLLENRQTYLLTRFRFELLHPRDLDLACELRHVPGWQDLDREKKVLYLTDQEVKAIS
jgi:hypothetical protein